MFILVRLFHRYLLRPRSTPGTTIPYHIPTVWSAVRIKLFSQHISTCATLRGGSKCIAIMNRPRYQPASTSAAHGTLKIQSYNETEKKRNNNIGHARLSPATASEIIWNGVCRVLLTSHAYADKRGKRGCWPGQFEIAPTWYVGRFPSGRL